MTEPIETPIEIPKVVEEKPPEVVVEKPAQKAVETNYRPMSGLLGIFSAKSKFDYFSITKSSVKCELSGISDQAIRSIVNSLNNTGYSSSSKSVSNAGNSSFIVSCKIDENILNSYIHPPEAEVLSSLRQNGFKVNNGIFIGNHSQVTKLLQFIEKNRFLFYRLIVLPEDGSNYRLSLEY